MKSAATIIRLAMCAGPKIGTSKPFWIWWRGNVSTSTPLLTHRFPIEEATQAYRLLGGELMSRMSACYSLTTQNANSSSVQLTEREGPQQKAVRVGLIGAGGYVTAMLLPHFKTNRADFRSIQTASGFSQQRWQKIWFCSRRIYRRRSHK